MVDMKNNLLCFCLFHFYQFNEEDNTIHTKPKAETKKNILQRRISFMIGTDFLCWVPFVTVCCLHTLAVVDATPWYGLFSIIFLPVNSVINPLVYDDTLMNAIERVCAVMQPLFSRGLTKLQSSRAVTLTAGIFSASFANDNGSVEPTLDEQATPTINVATTQL